MVVLMDAGNSRLKWAIGHASPGTVNVVPYAVSQLHTVKRLINELSAKHDSICMVHVLGEAFERELARFCKKKGIHCQFIHSGKSCCGVQNAYLRPQQLGADRFVAMIAAHHRFPDQDVVVVDCGTAVTIDALSAEGKHLGGLILPGLQLSRNALINNTHLQASLTKRQPKLLADNTLDAVNSGSFYGLAGAICHIHTLINHKAFAHPAKIIICGGDSTLVANHWVQYKNCTADLDIIPELVMEGLSIINEIKNA